jgi:hypothetical protein
MKKIYTLAIGLLASLLTFGQSQRLCLLEEFTQASCPPCAAQNPALNALLAANTTKAVSIKYQTNWPGVDPMNVQTQTWVGPRVTYYGVTGVPNIRFDGNSTTGAPNALTQTIINNRYAATSPFDIALTHTFSADYDSIFINMQVTCSQATSGTFKAHVALVEQEIEFCSAPGTNGEDIFYGVCRKMFPNAAGSTMAASYIVGDTYNVTFAEAIPNYIYGFDQLAVVGFVQDNTTKEVKQTGISLPIQFNDYAILKNCSAPAVPPLTCSSAVNGLTADITNKGTNTLTSADLNIQVNGGTISTFNWTGSLAPGATTTVNLPTITLPGNGSSNIEIWAANANGNPNPQCADTRTSLSLVANITGTYPPIAELFSAVTFPPTFWGRFDASNDNVTWTRAVQGSAGNNGSAKMDYYNSQAGNEDDLYIPGVDLTGVNSATLTFKICKAPYTGYTDALNVKASSDCGATWSTVWTKSDPQLSTVAALSTAFTPSTSSTWRLETVDLASFIGNSNVSMRFNAVSGYGNNGYIDEVNITTTTGVGENQLEEQISLFPTPSTGTVFLNLSPIRDNQVRITIMDATGKQINTYMTAKSNQHEVQLQGLSDGMYTLQIDADGQRISKRVLLNK